MQPFDFERVYMVYDASGYGVKSAVQSEAVDLEAFPEMVLHDFSSATMEKICTSTDTGDHVS